MASSKKSSSIHLIKEKEDEKLCVPKLYEKALQLEHDLHNKEKSIIVEKESCNNNDKNNNQQRNSNKTNNQNEQQQQIIENQIKMIRIQLCEILNDIILYNPQFAIEHNIIDKLWKNCFYNRIIKIRTRKMKVQQKIIDNQKNNKDVTKYIKLVSQYKQILNHDLFEGIHLYLYVCKILQDKFIHALKQTQQTLRVNTTATSTLTTTTASHKNNKNYKNKNTISEVNNKINNNANNRYINTSLPIKLDGIIECLRRLYIHVGDCYRYTEDENQKAKTMYTYSSRLGPGNGHSYNQLAVLSQQQHQQQEKQQQVEQQQQQQHRTNSSNNKDNNNQLVIALFYYCRAILATHQPFTTAFTNMERLFIENRQQLQQQQPQTSNSNSSKNCTNNNAVIELYIFCTNFIDMHYNIYLSTKTETTQSKKADSQEQKQQEQTTTVSNTAIEYSIQQTISKLEHLLNITAITDNLLCKLFTIHAFTIHYTYAKYNTSLLSKEQQSNDDTATSTAVVVDEKHGGNHFDSSDSSMCYSLRSTFLFSECISKRILITLTKQVKQVMLNLNDRKNKNTAIATPIIFPSIRLLLPLMIITEYFFHLITTTTKQQHNGIDTTNNLHHELENFWKLIVKILNLLKQLSVAFRLRNIYDDDDVEKDNNSNKNEHLSILQEYCTLRGYKPFQSFLQDIQNDGNISDEEASTLFDNNGENNTPSLPTNNNNKNNNSKVSSSNMGMTSTKPTTTEQQNRCKVTRFLYLGRLIAASDDIEIVFNSDNDKFLWITPAAIKDATKHIDVELNNHFLEKQKVELDSKNRIITNNSIVEEEIINDTIESLTYQHDYVGGNQLLVPGAMLQMQPPSTISTTSSSFASNMNGNKNLTMEAAASIPGYTNQPSHNGIQIRAATNSSNDIMEQTTSLLANSMVTTTATPPPATRNDVVGGDTYVLPSTRSFISPPPGFGVSLPPSSSQTTTNSVFLEEGGTSFSPPSSLETNNNNPNQYPMESIDQNYPVGFMESNFQNLYSFTSDPNPYGNNYLTTTGTPSFSLHQPPAYETRNPFVDPMHHYDSYQNRMLNSTTNMFSASSATEYYGTNNNQYQSVAPSLDDAIGINGNFWNNNDTGSKLIDSSLLHSLFSVDNDNHASDRTQNP